MSTGSLSVFGRLGGFGPVLCLLREVVHIPVLPLDLRQKTWIDCIFISVIVVIFYQVENGVQVLIFVKKYADMLNIYADILIRQRLQWSV